MICQIAVSVPSCFQPIFRGKIVFMRSYELVLVLRPTTIGAKQKKLVDTIKGWLKDFKIKGEEKGEKTLTFKIKRETRGLYFDMMLEGEVVPPDFEKKLFELDEVLTHLMLRIK